MPPIKVPLSAVARMESGVSSSDARAAALNSSSPSDTSFSSSGSLVPAERIGMSIILAIKTRGGIWFNHE
jgi:hypothetical protein